MERELTADEYRQMVKECREFIEAKAGKGYRTDAIIRSIRRELEDDEYRKEFNQAS